LFVFLAVSEKNGAPHSHALSYPQQHHDFSPLTPRGPPAGPSARAAATPLLVLALSPSKGAFDAEELAVLEALENASASALRVRFAKVMKRELDWIILACSCKNILSIHAVTLFWR